MPAVKTLEFRFKVPEISVNTPFSQSLLINRTGSTNTSTQFALLLEYTGSLTSGSYSGSIVNPYYQYGTLKFVLGNQSSSVYLPFFNGGWWSVMVNQVQGNDLYYTYTLYSKNKIDNGDDGNTIGFQASSSLVTYTGWNQTGTVQIPGSGSATLGGKTYRPATGSFQEVRYYSTALSESVFNDYVMSGDSIEGNTSSYNELFFRAALGSELYTGTSSIHPSVTGSSPTASFINGTSTFSYTGSYNFTSNTETAFYDQPAVGIKNAVSNKIKQTNLLLPFTGSDENIPDNKVLSPYISIQQNFPISSSYTRDVDYVEVAFSPQNEINEDIMDTFGYFNIGEYIGDPRQISSSSTSYPDLNTLRDEYFKKYIHNYNIWDYVRLIKYFDNSLFKMIKDWTPARTSLATGVVIKQHLLERNKYPVPQVSFTQSEYTASIGMYEITGSDAGGLNVTSVVTQSWTGAHTSISGSIPFTQNTEDEFFNGEFSGSFIEVSNGELNDCNVEIIQVYSTASLYSNINPNSNAENFNKFDLKYDKTYYFSFTITEVNGVSPGTFQLWNEGLSNKVLYNSPTISAGGTLVVDKIELSQLLLPIRFKALGSSGVGFSITNFTIFESYIEPDCLVLEGNAVDSRLNTTKMDVDYSNNNTLPVNQQLLLSGSAVRFPIPDSYYTSLNHITPRYLGSKYSGQYNLSSSFSSLSTPNGYPIDNFVNYFVYFDWIGGSNPQYPGGGNVYCTYLIDIEGRAYPLTTKNEYLSYVENIFKQGTKANILPVVYSSGNGSSQAEVIEGGALYNTIFEKSGSGDISSANFSITTNASSITYTNFSIVSGSVTSSLLLSDSTNFLDTIINTTQLYNPNTLSFETPVYYGPVNPIKIYNKAKQQLLSDELIPVNDTYFPLQLGDFIRFGLSNGNDPESLDFEFDNGNLYRILSTTSGFIDLITGNYIPGTITLSSEAHSYPQLSSNQCFRIMRRIPTENFVLIKNKPSYTDPGLLIPENFNPNYDPYELAKKAGLI
jgi:hypothetical protein